jgi:purine nucleoside phosphorylase
MVVIGVIGGSGLYQMDGLEFIEFVAVRDDVHYMRV